MDPIPVPKPKSVRDPNRPASSLLLAQVHHLQKMERTLPVKYHSGIFHKAIQTEGEAARYVRAVTEGIHRAHDNAARERAERAAEPEYVPELAAAADEAGERSPTRRTKAAAKKKGKSKGPKK
jgi:hypothetical protein